MGTRVVQIGSTRFTVWVNTVPVPPTYAGKAQAIDRGEQEAKTYHHVQVTRSTGGRAPRSVATWVDGERR